MAPRACGSLACVNLALAFCSVASALPPARPLVACTGVDVAKTAAVGLGNQLIGALGGAVLARACGISLRFEGQRSNGGGMPDAVICGHFRCGGETTSNIDRASTHFVGSSKGDNWLPHGDLVHGGAKFHDNRLLKICHVDDCENVDDDFVARVFAEVFEPTFDLPTPVCTDGAPPPRDLRFDIASHLRVVTDDFEAGSVDRGGGSWNASAHYAPALYARMADTLLNYVASDPRLRAVPRPTVFVASNAPPLRDELAKRLTEGNDTQLRACFLDMATVEHSVNVHTRRMNNSAIADQHANAFGDWVALARAKHLVTSTRFSCKGLTMRDCHLSDGMFIKSSTFSLSAALGGGGAQKFAVLNVDALTFAQGDDKFSAYHSDGRLLGKPRTVTPPPRRTG